MANLKVVDSDELDSIERYVQHARENNVRYMVYSELEEQYCGGLHALRDRALMPQEFRVVYEHLPTKTLIYEITPTSGSH